MSNSVRTGVGRALWGLLAVAGSAWLWGCVPTRNKSQSPPPSVKHKRQAPRLSLRKGRLPRRVARPMPKQQCYFILVVEGMT